MIVEVVANGDRLTQLGHAVATAVRAHVTYAAVRYRHVSFRSDSCDSGVRSTHRPFHIVFDPELNSGLCEFGKVNQRAPRCLNEVVTRRIVQLTVGVRFGLATAICLGFVLSVCDRRQGFARRFGDHVNFEVQVVFCAVHRFICFHLCREFLHCRLRSFRRFDHFYCRGLARVGVPAVYQCQRLLLCEELSCEDGVGRVDPQRNGPFIGPTIHSYRDRFRQLYEVILR